MTSVPQNPKIFHIVHVDRLASIIQSGGLLCDAAVAAKQLAGTTIGMERIKQRRLTELTLNSHPGLFVGQCVPFYFCPRSIMLYLMERSNNPDLTYQGGQSPIIHLQADLHKTVQWAEKKNLRWAFTLGNAGSRHFEDRANVGQLHELPWNEIQTHHWQQCKDEKQSEFLVEKGVAWSLIECIGVLDQRRYDLVAQAVSASAHAPQISIEKSWYY